MTAALVVAGEPPAAGGTEFFEAHIRPVLVERCYQCHSATAKKLKGNLRLDSRQGMMQGGDNGAEIVAGDPEKSRLIQSIRWSDPDLQMPPKEKLSAQQIEQFEQWVKMGAPDPRDGAVTAKVTKKLDVEAGKNWWAFQPVHPIAVPPSSDAKWVKTKLDAFVSAKLVENKIDPSPEADRRTLIRRAYLDLTGLRPTYEEVETFAQDSSPDAYSKLIDRLLASPRYGERWGRYWLDVARYAEDNPTNEATTPPYRFAWRYRDWVIGAVSQDVPYDRFVKLQLAADLIPDAPRTDLAALGYLGAAPVYHKDGRLSRDVIENLYTDDWDERVDAVSRGVLGLTVACARCHDHKFDPISSRDYYSLAGVFASTVATVRPVAKIDAQTETRFMLASQQLFYLSYVSNLLRGDPGSKPREARVKVERCVAEIDQIKNDMSFLRTEHPEMYTYMDRIGRPPPAYPDSKTKPTFQPVIADAGAGGGRRRRQGGSTEPFYNAVFDAGLFVNGSDPDFTMVDVMPGEPHDLHVLPGGNVAKPGEFAPRGFVAVLSKTDGSFHQGSGRRELADRIFDDAAPLAARVIVNRVWGWHFGQPLVATPSDFGAQGQKPTHPELLDDLAARFIEHGWSLKWLHREIMLSATYRQSSHPREDAARIDPGNRFLWRMNPRRLDIEAFRDCLLQAAGTLDTTMAGPSVDLEQPGNTRRTVYARISRGRTSGLLQLYDFPSAVMHSPARETTTTPLQQLFVMNSPFIQEQAATLALSVNKEPTSNDKIREMYHKALSRDPEPREMQLANSYLQNATPAEFAQALLSTNEEIFWP